jgi:hypothetical protein
MVQGLRIRLRKSGHDVLDGVVGIVIPASIRSPEDVLRSMNEMGGRARSQYNADFTFSLEEIPPSVPLADIPPNVPLAEGVDAKGVKELSQADVDAVLNARITTTEEIVNETPASAKKATRTKAPKAAKPAAKKPAKKAKSQKGLKLET